MADTLCSWLSCKQCSTTGAHLLLMTCICSWLRHLLGCRAKMAAIPAQFACVLSFRTETFVLQLAGRRCHSSLRGCLPSTGRGTTCFTQREHMWHGPSLQPVSILARALHTDWSNSSVTRSLLSYVQVGFRCPNDCESNCLGRRTYFRILCMGSCGVLCSASTLLMYSSPCRSFPSRNPWWNHCSGQ